MRHVYRLLALLAGCNLIGIADGLVYGYLAIHPRIGDEDRRILLLWAAATAAASYAVAIAISFALLRPMGRALDSIARGAPLDPGLRDLAARRALHAPTLLCRASTWIWVGSAATLAFLPPWLRFEPAAYLAIAVALTTILVGSIASVFVFYSVEWYARRRIVPLLVPDGRVSRIPGVRPVPLRFRLVVLVTTTCLLPVAVLTAASAVGAVTTPALLYLGAVFSLLGAIQVAFICHSMAMPVERLAAGALRVRDGDLEAHAAVDSADEIGRLAENFNEMVEGLRKARFVRETFGRYVSRQVADEILNGKIALGGELRTATVLFSDIRGFTAASENLPPAEVVCFLNRYLDLMVDVLVEHGGTIDKFIGDAIMASFGVPVSKEDDALRAVRCGLAMLERLRRWNGERVAAGELAVEIGIGIHTGEVVAGNIGSAHKMEYTVIGDTVNTSSRIEQLNKVHGTNLLVSAGTWELVKDSVAARALPPVEVKGKSRPVLVYEVTGLAPAAIEEGRRSRGAL